jgi:hypothetical protein
MDKKQEFQLEFERFKQKAAWESKIFYTILVFIMGVISFYIKENRVSESSFVWWRAGLSLFLIVGEGLINCYLDQQKDEIKKILK